MASSTSEIEVEGPELRHLGFVRAIAIGVFICACSLYDYAKRNHRILTLPARMVEVPLRIFFGPVCNKFQNLPDDLLVLADTIVDKVAPRLYAYTPYFARRLMRRFKETAIPVISKAVIASNEARARGPQSAARYVGSECRKFVITSMAKSWVYLNQYGLIRAGAGVALPVAAYWSRNYNTFIRYGARRGYPVVGHLPAIPMKAIAKAVLQESRRLQEETPASSRDITESN